MLVGPELEVLDQGFTRAKVLILLPYKGLAAKAIDLIVKLAAGDIPLCFGKPF
jgi:hypothetical protein